MAEVCRTSSGVARRMVRSDGTGAGNGSGGRRGHADEGAEGLDGGSGKVAIRSDLGDGLSEALGVAAETDAPALDVINEADVVLGGDGAALTDEAFNEDIGEDGGNVRGPARNPGLDDADDLSARGGAAIYLEVALEGLGEAGREVEGFRGKLARG